MAAYFYSGQSLIGSWHVGEDINDLDFNKSRVIEIQADGDELVAILRALGYTDLIVGERIFKIRG